MIQLTKDLFMLADDYCYTVGKLNKHRNEAQGGRKDRLLDNPTYYTTVAQAVQGALNRAMRQAVKDGSITTLRDFIREQDLQRTELEKLIAPLDSGKSRQDAAEGGQAAGTGIDTPDIEKKED